MAHNTQLTLPEITHDQALVLSILCDVQNRLPAYALKQEISHHKIQGKSSPAFYQLMGRMVEAGLIEHSVESHLGRDFTFYTPTVEGREALRETIRFYEQIAR